MKNIAKRLLSEEQKSAIAAHICGLEKTTSVEYVVGLVDRSSSYVWERSMASLLLLLIFLMPFPGMPHTIGVAVVGLVVAVMFFIAVSNSRWLLHWIVRALHKKQYERIIIRKKAWQIYKQRGMDKTRQDTAVFLIITLLERHIELICGEKILKFFDLSDMVYIRNLFNTGLTHQDSELVADAVIRALKFIHERLASNFPIVTDNPNELEDAVYVE